MSDAPQRDAEFSRRVRAALKRDWSKTAMIFARVCRDDEEPGAVMQRVIAELKRLAAEGEIETAGDLDLPRHSEVRLPRSKPASRRRV